MSREMKDSGVEWLGKIPQEWEIDRIKRAISSIKGGIWGDESSGDENDIDCVRIADFERNHYRVGDIDFTKRNIQKSKQKEFLLKNGDLIIEKSGGGEKTPVGFVALYDKDESAVYSNFTSKLTVNHNEADSNFLRYIFAALYEQGISFRSIKQTTGIQNIDLKSYLNEKLGYPSIELQKQIGNEINKKVIEINSIIGKTKSTLEDYKILKQSIITEAVTRGLDKKTEMKDSGLDWIGLIPSHWKLSKLKYEFSIKKVIAGEEGYNVLSVTQNGLKIKDVNINEGQMAADYSKYQIVNKGDYVMNHMDLLTGWVDHSNYEGVTSPDYRVFKMKDLDEHSSEYYKFIFQSCYKNRVFYGMGQGVSNLGRWRLQADKFLNFFLPIPPKKEQQEIAEYIIKMTKKYDELIIKKENLVVELEQYKKTIIYEYVTGKKQIN